MSCHAGTKFWEMVESYGIFFLSSNSWTIWWWNIYNYGEKISSYCTKYINVDIYPLYKCNFGSKYPHFWKLGWKLWLTRTQIRGKYISCGEPAISHDFHHVSLVQWTTCLLPTTRDTGSNPLGDLCETGILLLALSHYIGDPNVIRSLASSPSRCFTRQRADNV